MKLQLPVVGVLFALAAVQFTAVEAIAGSDERESSTPRFSADELTLLEVFGNAYKLNGKAVRPKSMTEGLPTVAELTKSQNRLVRELAEMGLVQSKLAELYQANRGQLQSVFERQYREQWPSVLVKMLVSAASDAANNNQGADIQEAAKLVEQLLGDDAQRTANEGLALVFFGTALGNEEHEKIRLLAEKAPAVGPKQKISIKSSIDTRPGKFAPWQVTNTSQNDLHHCLILTSAVPDREKIVNYAGGELLLNELILPPAGFTRKTVNDTQQAVLLRTMIANVPRGALLYVPRLSARGTVTFQSPCYLSITKSAHVSLWCDEGTVDRQALSNLERAKTKRR